ncbi:glyoxalase [Secundilactobacillus paracollinoides]|uniref:Glyoxalase n=1 Tax=Secundilactobacillus paracollinoides TaxID=240427 RepID=A0A1B2IWI5_9LACO|nr:VOC family protein [Secundilactobacillus paracollinoides]ANZ60592.1 glyoxalase [Secundilactobacillus paracollinoides]ANZ64898.1 glyoxalase [Secundilactobacillus paracollinoides]ANZ66415.1 glyoxalase [Secundilactobacillus paracollinoides]KRL80971.1 glyoxalase family protein [Secundilactobacillus paracollinoides DSM 15502 = JCM 11969]
MTKMVFINLPVTNLPNAIAFYTALGFKQNEAFSNEKSAAMIWSDDIWFMLLTHDFYAQFLQNQTIADTQTTSGAMIALSLDSVTDVKRFAETAKKNGGSYYHVDMGIPEDQMYELEVKDLDGNVVSVDWLE